MAKKANKKTAIVGLGYVGLPVALLAAEKGWQVVGVDNVAAKVSAINAGRAPMKDRALSAALKKYPISATTDYAAAADAAVIVICVPTPVTADNAPDLEPLNSAIRGLRPHLRPGQVLIVESTINPGVMDEAVVPLLKERRDLPLDSDGADKNVLYIAHCPERINPGDRRWTVRNIPRVIGATTNKGVRLAKAFYDSILEAPVKVMASINEAEAVKILENTFRDINIAYVNEMAKSFDKLGIDIEHVIAGAATKPFAFLPHYPGNGVGGHCISVDPYYMIERGRQAGFDHAFLKLARRINDSMPEYTVGVMDAAAAALKLSASTPVALLGLSYKKNTDDLRESPAVEIKKLLGKKKMPLRVFDPFSPAQSNVASLKEALAGGVIVMLGTNHDELVSALTPAALVKAGVKLVIDGKNALDAEGIAKLGISYYGIGRRRLPVANK